MNSVFWSKQKPLRMVWRVVNNRVACHLVGTAHFFPFSFRRALRRLVRDVELILFEGPLDEHSSARIAAYGRQGKGMPSFVDSLTPEAIWAIERRLRDRLDGQFAENWPWALLHPEPVLFDAFTNGMRPFAAFFSIWQTCLGWEYSVDMEGYQLACKLGKRVAALETLEEQLEVLDSISLERITRLLNDVDTWKEYDRQYVDSYLEGDLEGLVKLTSRFATRGPHIVSARDRILFERMKPQIEKHQAVVFLGFPHIPGVTQLFRDDGYQVMQIST